MLWVPAGVELINASGAWAAYEQSGWVIACAAPPAPERGSDTLVTGRADGTAGTVTAEVTTTHRDGGMLPPGPPPPGLGSSGTVTAQ